MSSPTSKGQKVAKDKWDKAQIIASLLTPIVTAVVGGLFAYLFNQAQIQRQRTEADRSLAVARAEAVTSLLPQLSSENPSIRRAALETVAALGDEEFAIRLSTAFGGEAAIGVVEALSSKPGLQESSWEALSNLLGKARASIGVIQSQGKDDHACMATVVGDRLVLSSGASVGEGSYVLFMPESGREIQVGLVLHDELRGLALFRATEDLAPALVLAAEGADLEDWLTAVGYSRGGLWRALPGRVRSGGIEAFMSFPRGAWPPDDPESLLAGLFFQPGRADIQLPPGFDGAPLLNDKGEIAGLVSQVAHPSIGGQDEAQLNSVSGAPFVQLEEIRKLLEAGTG